MSIGLYADSEYEAKEMIQPELEPDEQILWAGRPKPGIHFNAADIFLIPFGLLFVIFPLQMAYQMLQGFMISKGEDEPFAFFNIVIVLFLIPFIWTGFKVAFGRHVVMSRWKKNAYYAVTDKRVIVLRDIKRKSVRSKPVTNGMELHTLLCRDESGLIAFSAVNLLQVVVLFALTGRQREEGLMLIDVPDVKKVEGIIRSVMEGTKPESEAREGAESAPTANALHTDTPLPFRPPPYSVSLPGKLRLLFGNAGMVFGCIWLGFSMIFFWVFAMGADYTPLYFWTGKQVAPGRIVRVHDTGWKEGSEDSGSGAPIIAYKYTYTISNGRTYTGKCETSQFEAKEGERVSVEYSNYWPTRSRIEGVPKGTWPFFVGLFVLLFPVIGIVIILASLLAGRRHIRLLERGRVAYGTLTSQTVERGDDSTHYKLVFSFMADDGKSYTIKTTVNDPSELTDQKRELILYSPAKPSNAVLMDEMTGSPTIDDHGIAHLKNSWLGIVGFLLAAAVVLAHVVVARFYHFIK